MNITTRNGQTSVTHGWGREGLFAPKHTVTVADFVFPAANRDCIKFHPLILNVRSKQCYCLGSK